LHAPTLEPITSGLVFQGRYRIVRCLNAGAMGTVYEAVDERTKALRALKVMLPHLAQDAEMRVRFAQEARIVGDIESDHLVRVLDAGIDATTGAPFLVMDLLRGEELGQWLKRRGALPAEEVVLYLHQAALGLDKTHAAGVVHRDLKPENLFVTRRDDGTACVKILDFGVAKIVQGHGGAAGTRSVGTPLYMAPEQILGHSTLGPRTDVYALAHVAFTLLVGKPYWREEATSRDALLPLLARVSAGAVEPPSVRSARWRGPALPEAFDEWFFRATAKDPADRFASASLAISALAGAMRGSSAAVTIPLSGPAASTSHSDVKEHGSSAPLPSIPGLSTRRTRRRTVWFVAGAALLSAVAILGIVAMNRPYRRSMSAVEASIEVKPSATAQVIEAPSSVVATPLPEPVAVSTIVPMATPTVKKRPAPVVSSRVVPAKPEATTSLQQTTTHEEL